MMDTKPLLELMKMCETSKFWGNVKLNFRDGEMILVEVTQTLRPQLASPAGNPQVVVMAFTKNQRP